jgi:micrococcal nuclease
MNFLFIAALFSLPFLVADNPLPDTHTASLGSGIYRVASVSDGDTLVLSSDQRVRFACIDAPETPKSQREAASTEMARVSQYTYGLYAKAMVEDLIQSSGGVVQLDVTDTDRYGRWVAEVRLPNDQLVQDMLIQQGLAMVYEKYIQNCPSANQLRQSQQEAQQAQAGLWGSPGMLPPWEFRQRCKGKGRCVP